VHRQLKALLEAATAQQAESSASRQRSERERAGAPSAHGPNLPPSQHQDVGRESGSRHRRPRVDSGPTVTPRTPSTPDDELRASTTTATTARATTMTVDAGGATTATTPTSTTGHQTSEVRGLWSEQP
jgi:hypothetical protein